MSKYIKRRNIFAAVFALLTLCAAPLFAQTASLDPSAVQSVHAYQDPTSKVWYYDFNLGDYNPNPVGSDGGSSLPTDYRCAASFNLINVPDYSVISAVTLTYNLQPVKNMYGSTISIRNYGGDVDDINPQNNDQAPGYFTAIGSGYAHLYKDNVTGGGGSQTISFSQTDNPDKQIYADITSALSGNLFSLGFVSDNESGSLAIDNLSGLKLNVTYRNPDVTFNNSVPVGTITVNGVAKVTGYVGSWVPTDIYTVTASASQTYNGSTYSFDHWNTPTGNVSNATITVSSVPNTDVVYTAVYNIEYQITVQNDFNGNGNGGVVQWNSGGDVPSPYTTSVVVGQSPTISTTALQTNPKDGQQYGFVY